MKTKRTEITINAARVLYVSKPTRMIGICDECSERVDWLTVDEAAALLRTKSVDIFRLAERGELHSTETVQGILVVCTNSILAATTNGIRRSESTTTESTAIVLEDEDGRLKPTGR